MLRIFLEVLLNDCCSYPNHRPVQQHAVQPAVHLVAAGFFLYLFAPLGTLIVFVLLVPIPAQHEAGHYFDREVFHVVPASRVYFPRVSSASTSCSQCRATLRESPQSCARPLTSSRVFLFFVFRVELSACAANTPGGPVHRRSCCSDSSLILGCIASVYAFLPPVHQRRGILPPSCTASPLTTQGLVRSAFRGSVLVVMICRYRQSALRRSGLFIFVASTFVRTGAAFVFGLNIVFAAEISAPSYRTGLALTGVTSESLRSPRSSRARLTLRQGRAKYLSSVSSIMFTWFFSTIDVLQRHISHKSGNLRSSYPHKFCTIHLPTPVRHIRFQSGADPRRFHII